MLDNFNWRKTEKKLDFPENISKNLNDQKSTTSKVNYIFPGCARFPEILQNFSERQILWKMCSVVFQDLVLKLLI